MMTKDREREAMTSEGLLWWKDNIIRRRRPIMRVCNDQCVYYEDYRP